MQSAYCYRVCKATGQGDVPFRSHLPTFCFGQSNPQYPGVERLLGDLAWWWLELNREPALARRGIWKFIHAEGPLRDVDQVTRWDNGVRLAVIIYKSPKGKCKRTRRTLEVGESAHFQWPDSCRRNPSQKDAGNLQIWFSCPPEMTNVEPVKRRAHTPPWTSPAQSSQNRAKVQMPKRDGHDIGWNLKLSRLSQNTPNQREKYPQPCRETRHVFQISRFSRI